MTDAQRFPEKQIVIFEGCDCTGKTTAAKAYAAATGADYIHNGPYLGKTGSELFNVYFNQMEFSRLNDIPVVIDRCWVSENIYGRVLRGGSRLSPDQTTELLEMAEHLDVEFIVCDPGLDQVKNTWLSRRQTELVVDTENLEKVWNYYSALGNARAKIYDWLEFKDCSMDDLINFIED